MNYAEDGVREWAIQNACMWVRDYHVDGLRLDATHTIFDERPRTSWPSSPSACAPSGRSALVASEIGPRRPPADRGWGHDAQWADELHHQLHVLLTGEHEGYYAGSAPARGSPPGSAAPAREARSSAPRTTTRSATARSATGRQTMSWSSGRWSSSSRRRRRCSSWARSTASARPFQFFTDHIDPAIAEATRGAGARSSSRSPPSPARTSRPAGPRDVRAVEAVAPGRPRAARALSRADRASARAAARGRGELGRAEPDAHGAPRAASRSSRTSRRRAG